MASETASRSGPPYTDLRSSIALWANVAEIAIFIGTVCTAAISYFKLDKGMLTSDASATLQLALFSVATVCLIAIVLGVVQQRVWRTKYRARIDQYHSQWQGVLAHIGRITHKINHEYRETIGWIVDSAERGATVVENVNEQGDWNDEIENLLVATLDRICPLIAKAISVIECGSVDVAVYIPVPVGHNAQEHVGSAKLLVSSREEYVQQGLATDVPIAHLVGSEANPPFNRMNRDSWSKLVYFEHQDIRDNDAGSLPGYGRDYKAVAVFPVRWAAGDKMWGFLVLEKQSPGPYAYCSKTLAAAYADQLYNFLQSGKILLSGEPGLGARGIP